MHTLRCAVVRCRTAPPPIGPADWAAFDVASELVDGCELVSDDGVDAATGQYAATFSCPHYYNLDSAACERINEVTAFQSIPHSMWLSIVTFTTVGFGEIVPTTGAPHLPRLGAPCPGCLASLSTRSGRLLGRIGRPCQQVWEPCVSASCCMWRLSSSSRRRAPVVAAAGKVMGGLQCIVGLLAVALPATVIQANFEQIFR